MDLRRKQAETVCECDHFAPKEEHFCTLDEQEKLAQDFASLDMSNPQRVIWAVNELYEHRVGKLHDFVNKEIDLDTQNQRGDRLLDRILGAAPESSMKLLTNRAKRRYTNVLKNEDNLRLRHLLFYHAAEIHRCRHTGRCSEAANKPDL